MVLLSLLQLWMTNITTTTYRVSFLQEWSAIRCTGFSPLMFVSCTLHAVEFSHESIWFLVQLFSLQLIMWVHFKNFVLLKTAKLLQTFSENRLLLVLLDHPVTSYVVCANMLHVIDAITNPKYIILPRRANNWLFLLLLLLTDGLICHVTFQIFSFRGHRVIKLLC